MAKYRRGRVNEETAKELSNILREVKDPRVSGAFISITAAEVATDMKTARVYFSVMSGDKKEVQKGLKSAHGYIRKRLAETLNLRQTPELTFIPDDSIEYGAHINSLLNKIEFAPITEDEEQDDE